MGPGQHLPDLLVGDGTVIPDFGVAPQRAEQFLEGPVAGPAVELPGREDIQFDVDA
jgi:hypothetical protein